MNLEPLIDTTSDVVGFHIAPTAWTRPNRVGRSADRIVGRAVREIEQDQALRTPEPQEGMALSGRQQILMDWEGVVEEVRDDDFTARLLDRRDASKVDTHSVEIPFTEVQLDDISLVRPGAIFYLTIYRSTSRAGQTRRTTTLYFRRLPSWTQSMLASAEDRAQRWKKSFGVGKNIVTAK
jgi:hypothetical protein